MQNCKCNVTTANEMSQLQFERHNCKNKIAENVPCFLKSRNTSNFKFHIPEQLLFVPTEVLHFPLQSKNIAPKLLGRGGFPPSHTNPFRKIPDSCFVLIYDFQRIFHQICWARAIIGRKIKSYSSVRWKCDAFDVQTRPGEM